MGEHQMAVDRFNDAIRLDNYHAIAYVPFLAVAISSLLSVLFMFGMMWICIIIASHFQCGVSNFILGRYEHAYANFNDTFFHLRGNTDMCAFRQDGSRRSDCSHLYLRAEDINNWG